MRKLVIAVLLVLLLPVCSFAGTKLFKDYEYGMSKEEVRNKSKAVPCQDSRVRGNLCIAQPVPFAGKEWEMAFMLDKDRLVSVVLVKPFDEITYNNVMKTTLVKNGFTPLYARADSYEVDTRNRTLPQLPPPIRAARTGKRPARPIIACSRA